MSASDKESPVNFWVLNFFGTSFVVACFAKHVAQDNCKFASFPWAFTRPLRHKSKSIQFCTDHGISFHSFVANSLMSGSSHLGRASNVKIGV